MRKSIFIILLFCLLLSFVSCEKKAYTFQQSVDKIERIDIVFEAVKKDLGAHNVRELNSIDDPIFLWEYKVAMRCGPTDYHFIRLDGDQWYNKSGTMQGVYIDRSRVEGDVWYPITIENGQLRVYDDPYYDDEIIYFAVRKGWDS